MQAKTLMKTFLIEKWLWDEFTRYYTEVKLEWLYVKKEKLPQLVYTPRTTKTERLERNRKIKEMRDEWKTFAEIWNEFWISGQRVLEICKL